MPTIDCNSGLRSCGKRPAPCPMPIPRRLSLAVFLAAFPAAIRSGIDPLLEDSGGLEHHDPSIPPIFQCRLFSMTPYPAEPRGAAGGRSSNNNIISVRRERPSASVRPQPKSCPGTCLWVAPIGTGDGGQQAALAGRSDRGSLG